jgi:AraC-like DNA-binding protein
MLVSPRFIRDRPDGKTMDVLSDVIAVMRTGRPSSMRMAWQAPWARWFGPIPGAAGFHVILRGPCWLVRAGHEPLALAAGDVVFRPHGDGHTLADNPSRAATVTDCDPEIPPHTTGDPDAVTTVTLCGGYRLEPTRVHPLLTGLPELIHFPAHLGHHPGLRATVDMLATELAQPRLGTDAIVPALLDTLLLHILRAWLDQQPPGGTGTGWAAALNDPPTTAALQAMHRDPARQWTVASLAAEAGLSRSPFARRFTTLIGQPPLTYLTWWRMTIAGRLLHESTAPLSAIATRVGYGSEFAFAAAFKRLHGTAPGAFRRDDG